MVRKIILFFLICSSFSFGALQYLTRSTPNATATETVSSAGPTGDDASLTASLGFSFPFNNTTYTSVYISSNGVLNLTNSDTTWINTDLGTTNGPVAQSIYPYWDDIDPHVGGTITYGALDVGLPTERFVVSWNAVPLYRPYNNEKVTFQVVLYKNGDIRFRYPNVTGNAANGSKASIGVQEQSGNRDSFSYNSNSINFTKDILYRSNLPTILTSKKSCVISDPVNLTTNPKRIPGATIRYAVEISNIGGGSSSSATALDTISSIFNTATTPKVATGACNCPVGGGTNSGSVSGANVTINYGSVAAGTPTNPTKECGYFEAVIK